MSFVIRAPGPVGPPPQVEEVERPVLPECGHPTVETRRKLQKNGAVVARQCVACGAHMGTLPKASVADPDALPEYDDRLRERWHEARQRAWQDYHERCEAARHAATAARQEWYAAYLRSPQWRAKRAKVLERDGYACAGCGAARAEEVHHLTYDRVGREMLFDLVAVCAACHRAIHEGR